MNTIRKTSNSIQSQLDERRKKESLSLEQEKLPKGASIFLNCVGKIFPAYIIVVLMMIAFLAPSITYAVKQPDGVYGVIYLLIALLIGIPVCRLVERIDHLQNDRLKRKHFEIAVLALSGLLFIFQIYILHEIYFETLDWDVGALVDINNRSSSYMIDYFSTFTNQQFLAGIFVLLTKISSYLDFCSDYCFLAIIGCFLVTLSIALVALSAQNVIGSVWSLFLFSLMAILVGLQPWVFVPYSDSYGMAFPALVLFFLLRIKNISLKCFGITLFTLVGYHVKPTIIFSSVAIVLVYSLIFLLSQKRERQDARSSVLIVNMARILKSIGAICVACVVGFCLVQFVIEMNGVEYDESKAVGLPHFLMMGFNEQGMGVWTKEDNDFSQIKFDNVEDRNSAAIKKWLERIDEMGFIGVVELMIRKSLSNYNSGTFSFLYDGTIIQDDRNEGISKWYGLPTPTYVISPWSTLSQIIWMFVLLGIALCLSNRQLDRLTMVLSIALLMLSVFLLLFECRSRYLFIFAPYFVLLSVIGWRNFVSVLIRI